MLMPRRLTIPRPLLDRALAREDERSTAPAAWLQSAGSGSDEWLATAWNDRQADSTDALLWVLQPDLGRASPASLPRLSAALTMELRLWRQGLWQCRCRLPGLNGVWFQVPEVRIPGAGMYRLANSRWPTQPPATAGTGSEGAFSRTAGAMGGRAPLRRLQVRYAVVGAGRTGSHFVALLGPLQPESIAVIDPDMLAQSNLDAMALVSPVDLGESGGAPAPKALQLAEQVLERWPGIELRPLVLPVQAPRAVQELAAADVIVTATDHDAARCVAALAAAAWQRPHLDLGTLVRIGTDGRRRMWRDCRLVLPGEGLCLACWGGFAEPDELECLLGPWPGQAPEGLPWHAKRSGSLGWLAAGTAARGMELLDRLVTGEITHSTWVRDSEGDHGLLAPTPLRGLGDPHCPICRLAGCGSAAFSDIPALVRAVMARQRAQGRR